MHLRLILALLTSAGALLAADRPNILFVFSDDHAFQAISAYGSNRNHTPHIDRLAHEGMIFHNAMVTNSICAPSRAVILTGKYSHLNSVLDNRDVFDGTQRTFPKILRENGYQTAIFGKWHLKSAPTGFDKWEVLPGQGQYYNPDFRTPGDKMVRRDGYVTDIITDLALDWLNEDWDRSKPFMAMVQHKAPHRNWMPAPRHLSLYDGVEMPDPPTLFDFYENRASPARRQEMEIARHMSWGGDLKVFNDSVPQDHARWTKMLARLNPEQRRMWDAAYERKNKVMLAENLSGRDLVRWKYQRYIKDYLRTIEAVDENVGRLLLWLDAEGLAENTIVIYSSDQGFYLGEHGWFDKRWAYEESLRTPLLVRWPGHVRPGSESDELVSNLDYPETFLDIAGAEVPEEMQGESLVSILEGETPTDWRTSFYYHYFEGPPRRAAHNVARHYGVITKQYKLIHYYIDDEWELFDTEKDPLEVESVYGRRDYADIQAHLEGELRRLRAELEVPETDRDLAE